MSQITTAVFPVAGMGTRFLPVTKAGPKEMLPIIDKPLIQYVVEEAIAVGIKKLVFVTSSGKRAIEDYFDSNFELETMLEQKGKFDILAMVRNIIPEDVKVVYVRQPRPRGLGDAVLCAKAAVGDAPFAVLLADDIMEHSHKTCLSDMVARFDQIRLMLMNYHLVLCMLCCLFHLDQMLKLSCLLSFQGISNYSHLMFGCFLSGCLLDCLSGLFQFGSSPEHQTLQLGNRINY